MGRGNIAAEPQKPAPWPLCQAQKWAGATVHPTETAANDEFPGPRWSPVRALVHMFGKPQRGDYERDHANAKPQTHTYLPVGRAVAMAQA
jgi:hypothetical protein